MSSVGWSMRRLYIPRQFRGNTVMWRSPEPRFRHMWLTITSIEFSISRQGCGRLPASVAPSWIQSALDFGRGLCPASGSCHSALPAGCARRGSTGARSLFQRQTPPTACVYLAVSCWSLTVCTALSIPQPSVIRCFSPRSC